MGPSSVVKGGISARFPGRDRWCVKSNPSRPLVSRIVAVQAPQRRPPITQSPWLLVLLRTAEIS
jgi:hypothetical protein